MNTQVLVEFFIKQLRYTLDKVDDRETKERDVSMGRRTFNTN